MTACGSSCRCADAPAACPDLLSGGRSTEMLFSSRFVMPGMDCPAEESLVRMALEGEPGLCGLKFDLPERTLLVYHEGAVDGISARLVQVGMGAQWVSTLPETGDPLPHGPAPSSTAEHRVLVWLLAINAVMLVVELLAGWWAESTGLMADALDMLADAGVYGLALYAVKRTTEHQLRTARWSGWLQMALGAGALLEIGRRWLIGPTGLAHRHRDRVCW